MSLAVADLPAGAMELLAAMHAACFADDPWDAAALAQILAVPGSFGYLACDGDEPEGFLLARDLGNEIEILSLGVLPQRRRRGIGRALLAALVGAIIRRGGGSIVLEVSIGNVAAQRLYAAFGFAEVGRRRRYYHSAGAAGDALILRCTVTT